MKKVYYHTRHIPREHLDFSTKMGQTVELNGLCDVLESPIADEMREYGIDIIETRAVWWELEKTPGVLDFTPVKERIRKIKENGFGVGVFPWFQHAPEWFEGAVRLKCLEHGEESSLISLWDPVLLEHYDRMYGALARECGEDIDFLYVGVCGDYGEIIIHNTVRHYKFSPKHGHTGTWCTDRYARADWKRYLEEKYGSAEALGAAWEENIGDLSIDLMQFTEGDNAVKRMDFADWYTSSVMGFCDKVCAIVRKYFPSTRAALPIGATTEPIECGQNKSIATKIASKYNMAVRWTSLAHRGTLFAESNVGSRRVASAAKFYGVDFGVEASLFLDSNTAGAAIFELMANDSSIIHNDPMNIIRAKDVYKKFRTVDYIGRAICDLGVIYPLEGEFCFRKYEGKTTFPCLDRQAYYRRIEALRKHLDYELIDSTMMRDGAFNEFKKIFVAAHSLITQEMADELEKFSDTGGEVYYEADVPPRILESGEVFEFGTAITDYSVFGEDDGTYRTDHGEYISSYDPVTFEVNITKK